MVWRFLACVRQGAGTEVCVHDREARSAHKHSQAHFAKKRRRIENMLVLFLGTFSRDRERLEQEQSHGIKTKHVIFAKNVMFATDATLSEKSRKTTNVCPKQTKARAPSQAVS